MDILEIAVPDFNDSFSRVVIDNKQFLIRFSWSGAAERWSFGLYTMQYEPIAVGIKLVPRFPLNLQVVDDRMPTGIFGVHSDLEAIGRGDFLNKMAIFTYAPREAVANG